MSVCVMCHGASGLEPEYRLVRGWEKRSKGSSRKGGSDIVLREPDPSNDWACGVCISRRRDGIAPSQGALL